MARGESISEMYFRLGLDYNELESGFVSAERTIRENMSSLSRENTIIELQAQIELLGLDESADATRILEVRQRALQRQIETQCDRVRLASAQLRNMAQSTGENSDQARRAEVALARENLALARLESQLRRNIRAQEEMNSQNNSYNNNAFGGLSNLVDGILSAIPPQAKAAATAIAAIGLAAKSAGEASKELVEKWRELQTQAYELNMTVNDTENFLRHMKLAGGDIGDFEGFIRGISDAMAKGEWDDPEAMVFRRYNETAFDENGRIKGFQEMTETIKRMYDQAKAAGEEIEFLQMLGGESGVRDAIQYLERYEEATEDAGKIFDAGLDPKEFHEAERALNLLTEQTGEFKDATINIITPATTAALESLFEAFRYGTKILSENKDEIQSWGFIAAETFDTVTAKFKALKEFSDEIPSIGLIDFFPKELFQFGGFNFFDKAKDYAKNDLFAGILERAAERQDKYNRAVEQGTETQGENTNKVQEGKTSWADFRREEEQAVQSTKNIIAATNEATAAKQKEIDVLQQYSIQRTVALRDEIADVKLENQNFKHGYDLEVAKLALERERARRQNVLSTAEENAIDELYAEKRLLLEQETQDKLDDLRDEATAGFKTDLEKRTIEIENAKDDWIDAGMDEAEAETLAQKLKAKAITDLNSEVAANLDSIWHSSIENRLAEIEREKQAWIQKGIDEVKATQWSEKAKADAQKQAALEVLKSRLDEYHAFQYGGYEGLKEYQLNQLFKAGVDPDDLKMTPKQLQEFQMAQKIAQNSLLPNFMTNEDKILNQRLSDFSFGEYQRKLRDYLEENIHMSVAGNDVSEKIYQEFFNAIPKEELSNYAHSFMEALGEIPHYSENIPQANFDPSELNTGGINDLTATPTISNLSGKLEELSIQAAGVALSFNELTAKIENFEFPQEKQSAGTTPTQVTIYVQIQEAHAWDSEHIQELADKVADTMEPEIISALGDDANGY